MPTKSLTAVMLTLALSLPALTAPAPAVAEQDPIQTRKAIMSNVGAAAGAAGAMVRGQVDYNPRVAQLAMRTIMSSALAFTHYFPEGSETGQMTEAAPKIWEDFATFETISADMALAAEQAVVAAKGDLDSFRPAFAAVGRSCGACHEDFRIKKN